MPNNSPRKTTQQPDEDFPERVSQLLSSYMQSTDKRSVEGFKGFLAEQSDPKK